MLHEFGSDEIITPGPKFRLVFNSNGADYVNRALEVLHLGGKDVLCLTGGIGPHYAAHLSPAFRARISPPEGSALDGALRLARAALEEERAAT